MRRIGLPCVTTSLPLVTSTNVLVEASSPSSKPEDTTSSLPAFNNYNILPSSSSTTSSSLPSIAVSATSFTSQRFLRVAKSAHGYYIQRRGQFAQHWPLYRRPHNQNPNSAKLTPPWHWKGRYTANDPNQFLPKHNYVTGPWVGQFFLHLHQVYTLQHCNAGVPIRVKRFPTTYEFKEHSRWMIGKSMRNWVEPRAHIYDEAALTKKARLDLVKKGLMPPG